VDAELMHRSCVAELGEVVHNLNVGSIPDPGDFCLVQFADLPERICLYKPDRREAVVDLLGLNRSPLIRLEPQDGPSRILLVEPADDSGSAEQEAGALAAAGPAADARAEEPLVSVHEAEAAGPDAGGCSVEPVSEEMQSAFYEVLFGAVLPLVEEQELLTGQQARSLLERSELPAETLEWILSTELGRDGFTDARVDSAMLKRMGQLVAHAQAGAADLARARRLAPDSVPVFRGLKWDKRRPKKLRVEEPL